MPRLAFALALGLGAALLVDARASRADSPSPEASPVGLRYLRALGPHAANLIAPTSGLVGALVKIPAGQRAKDLGLDEVAPGIGRLRASPAKVEAFAASHPSLRMEIAPPLHPTLDKVGQWIGSFTARTQRGLDGSGVMVGVADTGLDVTHAEMRDANGKSRVAWMLDLSLQPLGVYPELEDKYGLKDDTGKLIAGAVFDKAMIDDLLGRIASGACVESSTKPCAPNDEIGHGTHVAGIAAASGAKDGKYPGVAPKADVVFVRVTRGRSEGIENDDLVRAVQFMFDRQDFVKRPMVVNLSLGSDFGPHDGTFLWEQTIASYIGPDHPGRAIVAAAGNSGSIVETPIHQSVHVTEGASMKVPIKTGGATSGSVQVWVTLRPGADIKIGLNGPDGEWIAPVAAGHQNGKNTDNYNAGIIFGSNLDQSPIPAGSNSGVVVWTGSWPSGEYDIVLEGEGMAELYLEGLGDAQLGATTEAVFAHGVREGTINLPATHPSIIGVGCTVNRPRWTSLTGAEVQLKVPVLDATGGLAVTVPVYDKTGKLLGQSPTFRDLGEGELCWFSSAGPTALGVPKPEIAAPGALVISSMSRGAKPGTPGSVFSTSACPPDKNGKTDNRCFQIDDDHAVAIGTSMSSPVVAGAIALLLQKDPTLTQDKILALLQGGAHRFRGVAPYGDQSGPGELDVMGALDALDRMQNPSEALPSAVQSWVALSSDYVAADGSTPLTAIVELRTADGQARADFFDKNRIRPVLLVDGEPFDSPPSIVRRGPGVWFFAWTPPAGLGGKRATFGATFDGQPIVAPRTIPIATDRWTAAYPSHATGSGCNVHGSSGAGSAGLLLAVAAVLRRRLTRSRA